MSMVDDLEAVKAIDKEIAENARLQQSYISNHAQAGDEYVAAMAQRETAVADALSRGRLPPDPPPAPASDAEHQDRLVVFANRASMLRDRRLQAVAAGKPEIDRATDVAYAGLIDAAGKPVAVLRQIARDVAQLQAARHETACAVVAVDPSRGMSASRPPAPAAPDAEAVVAAVTRRVDLLDVAPVRHLGLQNSNLHEMRQPPPGSEPEPGMKHVRRTSATLGLSQPLGPGR